MNKSELMRCVAQRLPDIPERDVEQAIKVLFEQLSSTLAAGGRCEIRGFGAFSVHTRKARVARNPKTGSSVLIPEKHMGYIPTKVRNPPQTRRHDSIKI
ncbi:MAG: HU family DNA-binding protein [Thiolinea sp.]